MNEFPANVPNNEMLHTIKGIDTTLIKGLFNKSLSNELIVSVISRRLMRIEHFIIRNFSGTRYILKLSKDRIFVIIFNEIERSGERKNIHAKVVNEKTKKIWIILKGHVNIFVV